jgi:hypothetical protein
MQRGERASGASLCRVKWHGDVLSIVEETSPTGIGAQTQKHPSSGFSVSRIKEGDGESKVQQVNERRRLSLHVTEEET